MWTYFSRLRFNAFFRRFFFACFFPFIFLAF